jgi:predicted SAM-dependent methyltransferase
MRFSKTRLVIAGLLVLIAGLASVPAQRWYRRNIKEPAMIADYLDKHPVRKLQLGADGNDPEGWLSSDIVVKNEEVYIDATQRFPLPDGSIHFILAEHLIEHLPWEDGLTMIKECHRVLAPGGKVRIITPNLVKLAQLVVGPLSDEDKRLIEMKLDFHAWDMPPETPVAYLVNRQMRQWGHTFIYDPATLKKTFEVAGFTQIREVPITEKDEVFFPAQLRTRAPGTPGAPDPRLVELNAWEAMVFEAVK